MARGEPVSTGAGSCGGVVGWVVWWGHQRLMGCGGVVWVAMVVWVGVVVWGHQRLWWCGGVGAWCGVVVWAGPGPGFGGGRGGPGGAGGRAGASGARFQLGWSVPPVKNPTDLSNY